MPEIIPYHKLPTSDLIVDAVYEGAEGGQLSGESLSKLIPGVGNLGGFRFAGKGSQKKLVILYTIGVHRDWPDRLENTSGKFTYFGDNKTPGREILDTPKKGNIILKNTFELLHSDESERRKIAPFLVFYKYPTPISARSIQFKGLAAPGYPGLDQNDDLIKVWKTKEGQRFQNYQSTFTILDLPVLERIWLNDILQGNPISRNTPKVWMDFLEQNIYTPLKADTT